MKMKILVNLLMVFILSIVLIGCASETTTETSKIDMLDEYVEHQTFDAHRENVIYILDDHIYTHGENGNGQLGTGDFDEHEEIQDITDQFVLASGDKIIDVRLGEYHAMALSMNGHLFAWGHSAYGKLTTTAGINLSAPTDITDHFDLNEGEMILTIESGRDHNGLITSEGRVFVFGVNAYGQLGIGEKTSPWVTTVIEPYDITEQFDLRENDFIIQLAFGNNHSMALSYFGHIFVWGDNERGQLGTNDAELLIPTDITTDFGIVPSDKFIDISVGYDHSGAMSLEGRVFVFGENYSGQLGLGDEIDYALEPMEITNELTEAGKLIRLRFAHNSSVIVGEDDVYVFGFNFYYELGLGHNSRVSQPTLLNDAKSVQDMVVAKERYVILYDDDTYLID